VKLRADVAPIGARGALGFDGGRDPAVTLPAVNSFDGVERLLNPYQRFRTSDPGQAETESGQLLSRHRLGVHGERSAFDAAVSVASFGTTSLYLLRYGAEVTIDRPPQSRYMTVLIPLTGTIEATHQGEEFVAVPGKSHVVLSEADNVHMRWSEDCTVISLRADIEALRSVLGGMLPGVDVKELRFVPRVESVSSRASMLGAIHLLTSSLTTQGLAPPASTERHLRLHALTTVLLGLEHNYSEIIRDPAPQISNRAVRRAIDIINAEEAAELTVVDVAREIGISLRALEMGFKKQIDMPPSQYLKKARLHRAHAELLAADAAAGTTVGGTAMNWGFAHAGRFSRAYRAEFGESPAATLRRRRS
jgi:AraC-like DNA-binding protein